jgi:hypothetical protein
MMPPPLLRVIDHVLNAVAKTPLPFSRLRKADLVSLPDGTFLLSGGAPALLAKGKFWRWAFEGYQPLPAPSGPQPVLTLPSMLACLAAGYQPRGPEALLAAPST